MSSKSSSEKRYNKSYYQNSPMGSPMKSPMRHPTATPLRSTPSKNEELDRHYATQIAQKEVALLDLLNRIQQNSEKLDSVYASVSRAKLKRYQLKQKLKDSKVENKKVGKDLEKGEAIVNKELEYLVDEYKQQIVEQKQKCDSELREKAHYWQLKLEEGRKLQSKKALSELEELAHKVRDLEQRFEATINKNNSIMEDKENRLTSSITEKSTRNEANLAVMTSKLETRKSLLSKLTKDVESKSELKNSQIEKMSVLDGRIRQLKESSSITSEKLEEEEKQLEDIISLKETKQAELDNWRNKFSELKVKETSLQNSLNQQREISMRTQFEIEILKKKLPVYVMLSPKIDSSVTENGDCVQVSMNQQTFTFSQVVTKELISHSLAPLVKETENGVNTAIVVPKNSKNWIYSFMKSISDNKNVSIHWVSFGSSLYDVIGSKELSFDRIIYKRGLTLDSQSCEHLEYTDISEESIIQIRIPHNKENNTLTIVLLSSPQVVLEVVSSISESKLGSKFYENQQPIKRALHSIYANTHSITVMKAENIQDLELCNAIAGTNAPLRKRVLQMSQNVDQR